MWIRRFLETESQREFTMSKRNKVKEMMNAEFKEKIELENADKIISNEDESKNEK